LGCEKKREKKRPTPNDHGPPHAIRITISGEVSLLQA
jgi:hypothetical protein